MTDFMRVRPKRRNGGKGSLKVLRRKGGGVKQLYERIKRSPPYAKGWTEGKKRDGRPERGEKVHKKLTRELCALTKRAEEWGKGLQAARVNKKGRIRKEGKLLLYKVVLSQLGAVLM